MRYRCFAALILGVVAAPVGAQDVLVNTTTISTTSADCSATSACVSWSMAGIKSVGVHLDVGTSGTFNWEALNQSSGAWFSINDDVNGTGSATGDGIYYFTNPGYTRMRLRASAISGNATVYVEKGEASLRSTASLSGSISGNPAASATGAAVPASADYLGLNIAGTLTGQTGFSLGTARAGAMAIVDGSGNQITSFGGGTQYATGSAQATPTGTVALGWDATNVRALSTNASGHLNVINAGTFATQAAQSGTWTVQPGNTANTTAWLFQARDSGGTAITDITAHAEKVLAVDATGAVITPSTLATHDGALTPASTTGGISMYRASAAAPTDVNADSDAVMPWALRSGAQVVQPSYAGTLAATATSGVPKVGVVGNAGGAFDAATGAAPPANVVYVGGLQSGATGGLVGGLTVCDSDKVINLASTTATRLITGVSGRKIHICSINLVVAGANNIALTEGTTVTTECDTGTAGVNGGTTAATGWNFAANSGIALGSGLGDVMATATNADHLCIVASAATQVSGHIKYAVY